MDKFKKKNLFIELNNDNLLAAVGAYDEELNFKILEKEIFSTSGFKNGKITNLEKSVESIKKIVNKIENKSNFFFSEVNVIINQTDFDCVNVSGFKKLNGNQILSEDISYILNDIKLKLTETEKLKSVIHLFNTKYLLDNKEIKNLPIGLYGNFYSHQLTFFMIKEQEIKNLKSLFNKCNLSLNKIILKSFTDGINTINRYKKDTFIKVKIDRENIYLTFFSESSFCYFQKFNFGSDIIIKDISKVCSIGILNVRNIVLSTDFDTPNKDLYVEKKYLDEGNSRKISLKHVIEIASARIEEIANIVFNKNKNLNNLKDKNTLDLYLEFDDKEIMSQFSHLFLKYFLKSKLTLIRSIDEDPFISVKIFGELLIKGWSREAIPVVNKKKSWLSRIFSGLFE